MKRVLVISSLTDIAEKVDQFMRIGVIPDYDYYFVVEYFSSEILATTPNMLAVKDFALSADVARILAWSLTLKLELVVSVDEFAVYIAGLVRDACGLDGLSAEASRRYRDKLLMVNLARSGGVRVPDTYEPEQLSEDIVFPLIVKPRALAGAVGVHVVKNWSEWIKLRAGLVRSAEYTDMAADQVLVQELIDAPIHHLDFVVRDGRLAWGMVSIYTNTPLQYLDGTLLISRVQTAPQLSPPWRKFVDKIHKALHLDDGVYHLEAFYPAGEEPIFLEIGYRPGGAMVVPLVRLLLDVDLVAIHLSLQMKCLVIPEPRSNGVKAGAWLVVPKHHGSKQMLWVDEIRWPKTPFVSAVIQCQTPNPGDLASGEFFCHEDSLGSFAFVGEDWQINRDVNTVCNEYQVIIKSEKVQP